LKGTRAEREIHEIAIIQTAATTDDTCFNEQWELSDIDVPQAWDVTKGSSDDIKVAAIDTGFDRSHEDFNSAQILNGCGCFTDNSAAVTTDAEGHGTEVTSVIAAATADEGGKKIIVSF
jgi:subtilisin family serine protease